MFSFKCINTIVITKLTSLKFNYEEIDNSQITYHHWLKISVLPMNKINIHLVNNLNCLTQVLQSENTREQ